MVPECYFGAFLLCTIVSTAVATVQRVVSENQLELEVPPPPPDDPSPSGMLRREKEKEDGPFERGWEQVERKASIMRAFDYIDHRIENKLQADRISQPPRTSNLQESVLGVGSAGSSQLEVGHDKEVPPLGLSGVIPHPKTDLSFEYQSAIGRDGYEPDPLRSASEFFGPFRLDYKHHTVYLENWNMAINTRLNRGGMGNLIVGLNHSYDQARNSVILGDSNSVVGSYGLVTGEYNAAHGRGAVITGGAFNQANAPFSSVAGGSHNNAAAIFSSVRGGENNLASGQFSVVTGGQHNIAAALESTVTAGYNNRVLGNSSSINGGAFNTVPEWNTSETIEGGERVGAVHVTGPPPIEVVAAENTDNPVGLVTACGSAACEEEDLETREKTAAARVHLAGHDHEIGDGVPEVRRRRSTSKNYGDED